MVEYSLDLQNINLSAIRTVRVLRPLKAINRVPSELVPPALPQAHPATHTLSKTAQHLPVPGLCWARDPSMTVQMWALLPRPLGPLLGPEEAGGRP